MPNPNIRKAGKWNATIQQGSTFEQSLRIEQLDLTEYSFRGSIKKSYSSPTVATYSFTLTSNNTFTVGLSAANTSAITAGDYIHDIEIFTADDAYVARIIEGKVKVTPEVTK